VIYERYHITKFLVNVIFTIYSLYAVICYVLPEILDKAKLEIFSKYYSL